MTLILTDRYSDDLSMADQLISVADNNKVLVDLDSSKDILARARKGIYTGIAICEPSIIDLIPHGYSTLLDAVLYPLAKEGLLYGYFTTGYWRDIGTIDNYMKANFDIISGLTKLPISGRLIGDNIWIDETAEIDFTVQIEEPVLIGKGVQIERGAKIGPYVVIDDGCEIGPKVEIKQSILWKKSKIEGSSTIKSSIITEEQKVPMGNRLRRVILQDGVAEAIFNV